MEQPIQGACPELPRRFAIPKGRLSLIRIAGRGRRLPVVEATVVLAPGHDEKLPTALLEVAYAGSSERITIVFSRVIAAASIFSRVIGPVSFVYSLLVRRLPAFTTIPIFCARASRPLAGRS